MTRTERVRESNVSDVLLQKKIGRCCTCAVAPTCQHVKIKHVDGGCFEWEASRGSAWELVKEYVELVELLQKENDRLAKALRKAEKKLEKA